MGRTRVTPEPPDLEALRLAVREEVNATNGRAVAKAIGLSRSWVHKFANGIGVPRERTARRIREWYANRPPEGSSPAEAGGDVSEIIAELRRLHESGMRRRDLIPALGLPYHVVDKLLYGGPQYQPHTKTIEALKAWHARREATSPSALVVEGAIGLLGAGLPAVSAKALRTAILSATREAYQQDRADAPEWFHALRP